MNGPRLLRLADYLAELSPHLFKLAVVVEGPPQEREHVTALPDGCLAGPVGWLPAAAPDAWCWLVDSAGQIVPVFKGSSLWAPRRHDFAEFKSCYWQLGLRLWRQVGEWFEIAEPRAVDWLFSPKGYHLPPTKDMVVERLRQAALQ